MQAAHMTFEKEALKLRTENKQLRQENALLKRFSEQWKQKAIRLEQKNKKLDRDVADLKKENAQMHLEQDKLKKQVESCLLVIEELRSMVFGRKKKKDGGGKKEAEEESNLQEDQSKKRKKADRAKESYRRSAPADEEVTDTVEDHIDHCPDCGGMLTALGTIIRYVEDMADLTQLARILKRVEKHIITTGYCKNCRKRKAAIPVAPQASTLGENVKKFITYLIVIMRQSFAQVSCLLMDIAGLGVSDGEIVASLDQYAQKLLAENARIAVRIRGAPGRHYDETGWRVQQGKHGNYCWASTPTEGEDTLFLMGKSRGRGVAEELRGEADDQAGITDDYAAYDNLFKYHQLCMSHPKRKLRDLKDSKVLTGEKKAACMETYAIFSSLYADLEKTLKSSFQKEVWLKKRAEYLERMKELAVSTDVDPDKLRKIKQALMEKAQLYFTCLLKPGIPADNNKAERKIRHVVLKRKSSQGSKSDKGAKTMSILCTTLLSCWWGKPKNFFVAYEQMLTA